MEHVAPFMVVNGNLVKTIKCGFKKMVGGNEVSGFHTYKTSRSCRPLHFIGLLSVILYALENICTVRFFDFSQHLLKVVTEHGDRWKEKHANEKTIWSQKYQFFNIKSSIKGFYSETEERNQNTIAEYETAANKELNFYFPRPCEYIRGIFSLLHTNPLTEWTFSINCEPSFSVNIFRSLKARIDQNPAHKECSVLCNAMSINASARAALEGLIKWTVPPFSDFTKPNFSNWDILTYFGYLDSSERIYYPTIFTHALLLL